MLTPTSAYGYSELRVVCSQPWEHAKSMTDVDQVIISIQTLYIISLCTIKLSILLFYIASLALLDQCLGTFCW